MSDFSKCPSNADASLPCRCYEISRGLPYPEQAFNHLEAEMLKERPGAVAVKACTDPDDPETYHIDVTYPGQGENSQTVVRYSFTCGSDDDAYCFVAEDRRGLPDIVILPLWKGANQ